MSNVVTNDPEFGKREGDFVQVRHRSAGKFMGGRKQTEDFFRLFLAPEVHHSGGGPGFTEFDSMTALENWVEKGQAPDKFIACRPAKGAVESCRPVFPYPVLARYSGKGDPKQADSFGPFDPTQNKEKKQ